LGTEILKIIKNKDRAVDRWQATNRCVDFGSYLVLKEQILWVAFNRTEMIKTRSFFKKGFFLSAPINAMIDSNSVEPSGKSGILFETWQAIIGFDENFLGNVSRVFYTLSIVKGGSV